MELDEILRIFDPKTKAAFRSWVQSSALQMRGARRRTSTTRSATSPAFAQDGADVLRVLDEQEQGVQQLVKNTGVVFGALNERRGQLRGLIVNSQRTFSATASQDEALAQTFEIFPTFLDESRVDGRPARELLAQHASARERPEAGGRQPRPDGARPRRARAGPRDAVQAPQAA